jgi:hypothetical protein
MRVKVCVLLASVVVSTLTLPIATAGAATGTVCKGETGSSVFSPTLPAKTGRVVDTVQHTKGTLSGCNNGVTGGTLVAGEQIGDANCATAATLAGKHITIEKVTWKPASKGTSTLRLTKVTTQQGGTFHGTVTAGRFKGTDVSFPLLWLKFGPSGACVTAGLKTIVFKSTAAVHI